jgi:hypothetical protein
VRWNENNFAENSADKWGGSLNAGRSWEDETKSTGWDDLSSTGATEAQRWGTQATTWGAQPSGWATADSGNAGWVFGESQQSSAPNANNASFSQGGSRGPNKHQQARDGKISEKTPTSAKRREVGLHIELDFED